MLRYILTASGMILLLAGPVLADRFHYGDIMIGERASGMGGAFCAVSDDASGAFYNPAGMAFSDKSYISLSANTLKTSNSNYSNIVGNHDWQRYSSTFIPSSFGLLQDFDGFKLAFSMLIPKADVINQDDSVYFGDTTFYKRNYNDKDILYMIGPSIAFTVTENLSLGTSLFLTRLDREMIQNEWVDWYNEPNEWYWRNRYVEESGWGLTTIAGIQYMPSRQLSCGLVVKHTVNLAVDAKAQLIQTTPNFKAVDDSSASYADKGYLLYPFSITTGVAYFIDPKLMLTCDVTYYPEHVASISSFSRKSLINVATGIEYYLTVNTPVRAGFYTNGSNVWRMDSGVYDVDLYGLTCSLGWETEFSSISIGADYSWGRGQIEIFDDIDQVNDASMNNLSIFLAGSYMM